MAATAVSGFTFCRNAVALGYPLQESIRSILPIVDEFIVAVGPSVDSTVEAVEKIGSSKIRIVCLPRGDGGQPSRYHQRSEWRLVKNPTDPFELSGSLMELFNEEKRRSTGEQARKIAFRSTMSRKAQETMQVYQEVLQESSC